MGNTDNYVVDGYDLSKLFDTSIRPISFAEPTDNHIPELGSIIYSVWDKNENFIYIGIAGIRNNRKSRSRMRAHRSGRRSGDQFSVYVQDFFVIPEVVKSGAYKFEKGKLDKLTKEYIQKNFSYRFVCFQSEDGNKVVQNLEKQIQNGVVGFKPLLNGS